MDEKMSRVARIVAAMPDCTYNLVLFDDDPEVWFQYYLGLYFGKPTILIMKEADKGKFAARLYHPYVKKIISVPDFTEEYVEMAGEQAAEIMRGGETHE